MNAVECRNVSKVFNLGLPSLRRIQALDGVTFAATAGEIVGLIGPNGSGKSTTIKAVLGLVRPDAGEALLFGKSPRDPTARRGVGYLPESPVPFEYLSGRQYLELQCRLAQVPRGSAAAELERVVALVQMQPHQRSAIRTYSKGMVQRITLAGALLGQPRLLILDEPTSGLDPLGRNLIRDLVRAERARGTSILFCTHILSDVEDLCDRVVMLVAGKLRREGAVRDLVSLQSTYEVVAETLGNPIAAFEGTTLLGESGGRATWSANAAQLQEFLKFALAQGYGVSRVQPRQISLEASLLNELKADPGAVGGNIQ